MNTPQDGGPAFPVTIYTVICTMCRSMFAGKSYNKRDRRCPSCKRKQQNARNAQNPESMRERARASYARRREYWSAYTAALKLDPVFKQKRAARRKVATEIHAGRLHREPCEKCGSATVQAHHTDYSRPLQISWLCKRCHCAADAMLAERAKGGK